ncbi:MAG: PTS sugar transporter subunit IIA [Cardiobacteriaceae bacterium]|nr:PTS sugar transporter subunit IIA [Cardiobacteriaceae bacterium]
MLLSKMLNAGHVNFKESFPDWQSAIHGACEPLVADGTVEVSYADEIIACIEKYGPYIVIAPDIAMPHSQENAVGVHKTAISFMKVNQMVAFDPDDREKDARLFFTLASQNHDAHLENMSALAMMLDNEALIADLIAAHNTDDLRAIAAKYNV